MISQPPVVDGDFFVEIPLKQAWFILVKLITEMYMKHFASTVRNMFRKQQGSRQGPYQPTSYKWGNSLHSIGVFYNPSYPSIFGHF